MQGRHRRESRALRRLLRHIAGRGAAPVRHRTIPKGLQHFDRPDEIVRRSVCQCSGTRVDLLSEDPSPASIVGPRRASHHCPRMAAHQAAPELPQHDSLAHRRGRMRHSHMPPRHLDGKLKHAAGLPYVGVCQRMTSVFSRASAACISIDARSTITAAHSERSWTREHRAQHVHRHYTTLLNKRSEIIRVPPPRKVRMWPR